MWKSASPRFPSATIQKHTQSKLLPDPNTVHPSQKSDPYADKDKQINIQGYPSLPETIYPSRAENIAEVATDGATPLEWMQTSAQF